MAAVVDRLPFRVTKAPALLHHFFTGFLNIIVRYLILRMREQACSPKQTNSIKQPTKMRLNDLEGLELPPSADMHVHLRQGRLMELVVSQIHNGGVDTVFVCDGKS